MFTKDVIMLWKSQEMSMSLSGRAFVYDIIYDIAFGGNMGKEKG